MVAIYALNFKYRGSTVFRDIMELKQTGKSIQEIGLFLLSLLTVQQLKTKLGDNLQELSGGNQKGLAELQREGKSFGDFMKKYKKTCESNKVENVAGRVYKIFLNLH